jgi:hypothetical protein
MMICHPVLNQAGNSGKARGQTFIKYSVASLSETLDTFHWHSESLLICTCRNITFLTLY